MAILTIGRVGLETADLDHPAEWRQRRNLDNNEILLRGFLKSTSATNTDYLRTELYNQVGQLTPVTYTLDPKLDGYYILSDYTIETIPVTYRGSHFYVYELTLIRIGTEATTQLQSLLTIGDVQSNYGTVPRFFHATPVGAYAYEVQVGTSTEVPIRRTRVSEDGNVSIYFDYDQDLDPTWSVSPANFYKGGCYVYTEGLLRAGTEVYSNDPTDWYIGNSLVECRPVTYQSTSNGRWQLRWYHPTLGWTEWLPFRMDWSGTDTINSWEAFTVVKNTPEVVVVRLTKSAQTANPSAQRHTLDMTLRRGSLFVTFLYSYSTPADHQVAQHSGLGITRSSTEASFVIGATQWDGKIRWSMGSPSSFAESTATGTIQLLANSTVFPFWIGGSPSSSTDGDGHNPIDLARQYVGWASETVRAVLR